MALSDKRIYDALQVKIDALQSKIIAYKQAQSLLISGIPTQGSFSRRNKISKSVDLNFKSWLHRELKHGELGSRELMIRFNKEFNKDIGLPAFSSKLWAQKKNGVIDMVKYSNASIEGRYRYKLKK